MKNFVKFLTFYMLDQILSDFKNKCNKVTDLLVDDLNTVKTGRAKPSLIEHIKVEAYGSFMEVRELASISAPDAQTIEIKPWDKSVIKALEIGIGKAPGNFNPVVNGEIIRISIPALTEETRKDLCKLVSQKMESHKQMMRQERNDAKRLIEDSKNKDGVSEDDVKNALDNLQKITDETNKRIEEISSQKEEEIMTI